MMMGMVVSWSRVTARSLVALLLFGLLLLATASPSNADKGKKAIVKAPSQKIRPLVPKDVLSHPDKARMYSEAWTAVIQADSGHILYLNFILTNIGVFSGASAVSFSLSPAAGGEAIFRKFEHRYRDFSQNNKNGRIVIGPHSAQFGVKADQPTTFSLKEGDTTLEMTLTPWMGGVKFGDGTWHFPKGRFTHFVQVPRATVRGKLKVGGKEYTLDGNGYVDHSIQDVLSSDFAQRWYSLRLFSPEHTVIYLEFLADKEYGGKPYRFLLVTDRNGIIAATTRFSLRGSSSRQDSRGCPRATRFDLKAEVGSIRLDGHLVEKRLHERNAVLDNLGWAQRQVAAMVAGRPIIYRQVSDYVIRLGGVEQGGIVREDGDEDADENEKAVSLELKGKALTEVVCTGE